jgi:uncharacterized phage-associated protein
LSQFTQRLHFDIDRSCQAVAFLLRNLPGRRMNYMRLLKVLYIAERESLRDAGKSLTGSRVVAMKRGPVLEDVYGLIRGQHMQSPEWAEFFQVEGYHLKMVADPGVGVLSRFFTKKLLEVAERHERDDEFAMVEITHQLPEWQRNNPGDSSKPIPLTHILEAVGRIGAMDEIVAHDDSDARELAECRTPLRESVSR